MKVIWSLQSVQDALFHITGRLQEICFPTKLPYPNIGAWSSGCLKVHRDEDSETWQRMIRLDAVRTNREWIVYSPSQAAMSKDRAHSLADAVDYEHLEPCRVFCAAWLVAIFEAHALCDDEIGYEQPSVVMRDSGTLWDS